MHVSLTSHNVLVPYVLLLAETDETVGERLRQTVHALHRALPQSVKHRLTYSHRLVLVLSCSLQDTPRYCFQNNVIRRQN